MGEYKLPRPSAEELEWERTFVRPNSVWPRVRETVIDGMDDLQRELRNAMAYHRETVESVAGKANVDADTVSGLLEGRPASADDVLRVLRALKLSSPTLPWECMR